MTTPRGRLNKQTGNVLLLDRYSSVTFDPSRPQDLQRDIEQQAESVASVLALCDVLLRDADACGGDHEGDAIRQTSRSLDRRWRNICAASVERRMRWGGGAERRGGGTEEKGVEPGLWGRA